MRLLFITYRGIIWIAILHRCYDSQLSAQSRYHFSIILKICLHSMKYMYTCIYSVCLYVYVCIYVIICMHVYTHTYLCMYVPLLHSAHMYVTMHVYTYIIIIIKYVCNYDATSNTYISYILLLLLLL